MQFAETEITAVTDSIWSMVLDLQVVPIADSPDRLEGEALDGVVQITGDWNGAVVVQMPPRLAAEVCHRMLGITGDPTVADLQDAVGEIVNMTGGSLKALLPGENRLSLPTVVDGRGYSLRIPGASSWTRVVFECLGDQLVVSLVVAKGSEARMAHEAAA